MKLQHFLVAATMLATSVGLSSTASAATYGAGGTATFQYYAFGGAYTQLGSPTTFSTPGSANFYNFTVNAAANQLIYTFTENVTWSPSSVSYNNNGVVVDNGSVIFSNSGIPAITDVTLDSASLLGSSGFSQSNVTFNPGAVGVSWANRTFQAGNTVILNVASAATGAVPEPATWAMMALGFGAMGFAMRRKKVSTRVRFA